MGRISPSRLSGVYINLAQLSSFLSSSHYFSFPKYQKRAETSPWLVRRALFQKSPSPVVMSSPVPLLPTMYYLPRRRLSTKTTNQIEQSHDSSLEHFFQNNTIGYFMRPPSFPPFRHLRLRLQSCFRNNKTSNRNRHVALVEHFFQNSQTKN